MWLPDIRWFAGTINQAACLPDPDRDQLSENAKMHRIFGTTLVYIAVPDTKFAAESISGGYDSNIYLLSV